jgi:hypothetical protein
VQFKEFGIRLNFTPVVNGNRVHLKVRPEVSTLDFTNAVVLQGFRIPALSTRRTETELELNDGQTFAIAGLLNNTMNSSLQKIPGIGNIPVLGLLFTSKAAKKDQTELVVMITPQILPNNSPGVSPTLPRLPEPFLPALPNDKTIAPPPPAFGQRPSGALNADGTPAPAPQAASTATPASSAAAKVTALAPKPPKAMQLADVASALPASAPMNEKDKKALERSRREDEERAREKAKTEARLKAEEDKRQAAQDAINREKAAAELKKAEVAREREEKVAREQAKRDAEAARRAEEENKQQLERQREQQKVVDEAQARVKAAQAAYEAEVAKRKQQ